MKRILANQISGRGRVGFEFTNEEPQITLQRTAAYSGITGRHMLQSRMNVDSFNNDIKSWGRKTAVKLRQVAAARFQHGKKGLRTYKTGLHAGKTERKLSRSIRARFRKERGGEQIDTIGFALERHGVFLQKGVGKGYVSNGNGVTRVARGEPVRYRFKNDWFNGTLEKNLNTLSEIIVKHTGDAIVLNTKRMFIQ